MPSAARLFLALSTLLLAAGFTEQPAHALDLALSFAGPKAAPSTPASSTPALSTTVRNVGAQQRLVAIEDGQGDRWVIELSATAENATTVTVSGTARILEVNDPATVRHFEITAQIGQPVAVTLADPAGATRQLVLVAAGTTGSDGTASSPEVVCEILPTPDVDDLAQALQEQVDEGREPHTGVGRFKLGEDVVDATWVCGW